MWDLLRPKEHIGLELTSSLAMLPASSVSALCFGHEQAKYFAVGMIDKDQVEDYAARKKMDLEKMRKVARASSELQYNETMKTILSEKEHFTFKFYA